MTLFDLESREINKIKIQHKMSRKQKERDINKVFIVTNSDGTITATFLGAVLLKKVKLPIDDAIANELIETLQDKDKRADFCVKKGINEQMANEAVAAGACKIFAEELLELSDEPSTKKAKVSQQPPPSSPPKKVDDLQSPSPKKTPAMKKKRGTAAKKPDTETPPPQTSQEDEKVEDEKAAEEKKSE